MKTCLTILSITFLLCVLLTAAFFLVRIPSNYTISESYSPDDKYRIEVRSYLDWTILLCVMPGQGGDREGVVYLIDNKTNKILRTCEVGMVNFASNPIWTENGVWCGIVFDWEFDQ